MEDQLMDKIDYAVNTVLYKLIGTMNGNSENMEQRIMDFLNFLDNGGNYKKYLMPEIARFLGTAE